MNKILVLLLCFIFSACAQYEARVKEQEKKQTEARLQKCIDYGFKVGTDSIANCLMNLEQSEKARQAATSAALLGVSNQYLQTPTVPAPTMPNSLNCTTYQHGAYGNINCH